MTQNLIMAALSHSYLDNLCPPPQTPTLAHFFKQLGWVEEMGSGVAKMYRYVPHYSDGQLPVIQEGDVFCMNIPFTAATEDENDPINGTSKESQEFVLATIALNGGLNTPALSERMGMSQISVKRLLARLIKAGLIEFRGARKNGGYYLTRPL